MVELAKNNSSDSSDSIWHKRLLISVQTENQLIQHLHTDHAGCMVETDEQWASVCWLLTRWIWWSSCQMGYSHLPLALKVLNPSGLHSTHTSTIDVTASNACTGVCRCQLLSCSAHPGHILHYYSGTANFKHLWHWQDVTTEVMPIDTVNMGTDYWDYRNSMSCTHLVIVSIVVGTIMSSV